MPMSNPNINPGAVETQQMRVVAPVGVRIPLAHSMEVFVLTFFDFTPLI